MQLNLSAVALELCDDQLLNENRRTYFTEGLKGMPEVNSGAKSVDHRGSNPYTVIC